MKVDVFLAGGDPFNEERLARRQSVQMSTDPARRIYVGEVSERQWRDVVSILRIRGADLELEPIEHNIYRGQNRNIGTGRIFGGQVLAQTLVATAHTVEEERTLHSMHGYFILAGDLDLPVVCFVDRLRDGGSFTTRRVTGIQQSTR